MEEVSGGARNIREPGQILTANFSVKTNGKGHSICIPMLPKRAGLLALPRTVHGSVQPNN
jgi:hypothetical protein